MTPLPKIYTFDYSTESSTNNKNIYIFTIYVFLFDLSLFISYILINEYLSKI